MSQISQTSLEAILFFLSLTLVLTFRQLELVLAVVRAINILFLEDLKDIVKFFGISTATQLAILAGICSITIVVVVFLGTLRDQILHVAQIVSQDSLKT